MTTTATPARRRAAGGPVPHADHLVATLSATLLQLAELVEGLTDEQYTRRPGGALGSSIGGHVRHNLDHVGSLLAGLPGGNLDYDRRERGGPVETDREAATALVGRLVTVLGELPRAGRIDPLRLTALVSPDLPPVEVWTTVGRELGFVLSHTVHHNALIAVIAAAVGAAVPDGFGYAPATVAHRRAAACAR
jgi:hypothetical protein